MTRGPYDDAEIRSLLARILDELAPVRHDLEDMKRSQDEHILRQQARIEALEWRNEDLQAQIRDQQEETRLQRRVIFWLLGLDIT